MIKTFKIFLFFTMIICTAGLRLCAQTSIVIEDGEKWYGGAVNDAHLMPFKDGYSLDMYGDTRGNQAVPLLISTKGRFIWSEEPFKNVSLGKDIYVGMNKDVFLKSLKLDIKCDTINVVDEEYTIRNTFVFYDLKLQEVKISQILE